MDLTTRVNLVQNLLKTKELPVKTGAALLDINRTSVYYKGTPISQEELDCKSIIDRLHTDNPAWGARQLSAQLKKRGHQVGRRKTRRYMNEMGIDPIYPKMNLSKRMQQAKVCPYLLRNAVIDRPNQAWSIDITYIPIKRGFLYLTAVIDWYSRCIVGWEVDDTLDTRMVITALKKAFMVAKPVILNSDQGCQFTSNEYMNFLKENQIRQSMDGKSRWADNIMIERWFRSFKYEEAYLTQYNNIREARKAIGCGQNTDRHTDQDGKCRSYDRCEDNVQDTVGWRCRRRCPDTSKENVKETDFENRRTSADDHVECDRKDCRNCNDRTYGKDDLCRCFYRRAGTFCT